MTIKIFEAEEKSNLFDAIKVEGMNAYKFASFLLYELRRAAVLAAKLHRGQCGCLTIRIATSLHSVARLHIHSSTPSVAARIERASSLHAIHLLLHSSTA